MRLLLSKRVQMSVTDKADIPRVYPYYKKNSEEAELPSYPEAELPSYPSSLVV